MSNNYFRLIDRTLFAAATPGQSRHGSDGNEEVLRIPQSFSITGVSPSDCLMSHPEHTWARGLTLPQKYSRCIVLSWPTPLRWKGFTPPQRCSRCIFQLWSTGNSWREIVRCILFPRLLIWSEMQTAFSHLWSEVTVSISYEDNECIYIYIYIYIYWLIRREILAKNRAVRFSGAE